MALDRFLVGLALALAFGGRKKQPPQQGPIQQRPAPKPKARAMLYRTPADAFDTTRVAVEEPGEKMRKRGIFSNPKDAWQLVSDNGWIAKPEVHQLEADPSE